MLYVGLPRYTREDIDALLATGPDGVILGDLFCDKRMFPYGDVELTDILRRLRDANRSVIYQTPMYATDRVFSSVLQRVTYCWSNHLIDAVIVQDIGLASAIRERCNGLSIIWGRMGYARTPVTNRQTLLFYMRHGIDAFECRNPEQVQYANALGAASYLVYGYPRYLTINRECYYRFEHNVFGEACGEGCLRHEDMLIPAGNGMKTTIDGYALGWQHIYDERVRNAGAYDHCNIYVDSLDDARVRLGEMREQVRRTQGGVGQS